MKVFAPGKVVLTGAYAVLDEAPAIVLATTRGATADTSRSALTTTPEVRAALGDDPAPHVDASALFIGARKLGLGASAAILVASLGARAADHGGDLADPNERDRLFDRAREAHRIAQHGGSGVDVAASVYGGVLAYRRTGRPLATALPPGASWTVFACATSASTAELRALVARAETLDPAAYRTAMNGLSEIAIEAARAVSNGELAALVIAVRRAGHALARLGSIASAPIVPKEIEELAEIAESEDAAFCVAGAGGGDVAIYLGGRTPSPEFVERANQRGLFLLDVQLDEKGVRVQRPSASAATTVGASPNSR